MFVGRVACDTRCVKSVFIGDGFVFVHPTLPNLDSKRKPVWIDKHDVLGLEVGMNQSQRAQLLQTTQHLQKKATH